MFRFDPFAIDNVNLEMWASEIHNRMNELLQLRDGSMADPPRYSEDQIRQKKRDLGMSIAEMERALEMVRVGLLLG